MFKCLKNLIPFCLLLGVFFVQGCAMQSQRQTSLMGKYILRGRIVEVNDEYRFVVINLGRVDGLKDGMVFSVFQRDEETAKIKVKNVRKNISACDIQVVYAKRGIKVGDLVIYKELPTVAKMLKPLEPTRIIEPTPIVVDIDAPKRKILKNTMTVFKEFGVMITESDFKEYTLKAKKNLELPLGIEIVTEYGPFVRNNVYYTAEVTSTPRFNRLIIRLRGVYDQEGQAYNHEIAKTSTVYKEAQEMAFTIKDLSEKL